MAMLLAFASLPFALRGGTYTVRTDEGLVDIVVSERSFNRFLTITSRPELAQSIPEGGEGEGFTSYTWYDHPFVLRVVFGRNVASLGSVNSGATIVRPLPERIDPHDESALSPIRQHFSELALAALNYLIALVRRRARLYQIFDLWREDIDVTVRSDDGAVLVEDPLQEKLIQEERVYNQTFDLMDQDEEWYRELNEMLQQEEPVTLAQSLLMEAERALVERFPRQAITTCYTAIEAAASSLLSRGMRRRDKSDREIDHLLATKSLPSKLDSLLRRYTGFGLRRDNYPLWESFDRFNTLRNSVVHRGISLSQEDAEFSIGVTREVLDWLDMVRSRNK
ncbi:MAG: hypothetical protein U9R48_07835 [Chloroflexota bacterium]|nr:hypothetical protein [Chloroflexota bacterium]